LRKEGEDRKCGNKREVSEGRRERQEGWEREG